MPGGPGQRKQAGLIGIKKYKKNKKIKKGAVKNGFVKKKQTQNRRLRATGRYVILAWYAFRINRNLFV